MNICGILLAAGNSRRFGGNKLLHILKGKPMFLYGMEELCRFRDQVQDRVSLTVVTQYEEIAREGRFRGFSALFNPHPENGISSSISIGLKANPGFDAYLFQVADQPWIQAETFGLLVEALKESQKGIACVTHDGKTGNPCIFRAEYVPELLKLKGDVGGKHVIVANRQDTALVPVLDPVQLEDIDRP